MEKIKFKKIYNIKKEIEFVFGILSGTGLFSLLLALEKFQTFIPEQVSSIIFVILYLGALFLTVIFTEKIFRKSYLVTGIIWLLLYIYIKIFGAIL